MSEQLQDEIVSINSIYGPDTLTRAAGDSWYVLTLPVISDVKLQVQFPDDYPDAPPAVLGTQSTGSSVAKGNGQQIVDVIRATLGEVFTLGVPCIFDLVEETTAKLQLLGWPKDQIEERSQTFEAGQNGPPPREISSDLEEQRLSDDFGPGPAWELSDVVTEKKSVFVGRAALVSSVEEAKANIHHLLVTDKKAARATHNISAWRVQDSAGIRYQDCDDDGETAAGGRLLHLLELMGVWNVMVVVSRWYGGVHLGSDRFRIINQVARSAVVKGGWASDGSSSDRKSRK